MTGFKFDHIHLRSPDPEATAAFYERMFSAELIRTTQMGKPRIDVNLGGQMMFIARVGPDDDIADPPAQPHLGLEHIGLIVEGIDAVAAELKAKGAAFTMEPTTIPPAPASLFSRARRTCRSSWSTATREPLRLVSNTVFGFLPSPRAAAFRTGP